MSYREAGAIFGKDHSTAIHAVSVITEDIKTSVDFRKKIKEYQDRLTNSIYANWPSDHTKADRLLNDVQKTITQMKRIAEAYCKLTGKRMIDA